MILGPWHIKKALAMLSKVFPVVALVSQFRYRGLGFIGLRDNDSSRVSNLKDIQDVVHDSLKGTVSCSTGTRVVLK